MKKLHRDLKYAPRPPRPRIRDFFAYEGPRWVDLNPLRLAFLGGVFFGWLQLVYYIVRTWFGATYTPQAMLLGVGRTFLVSYALVGGFVCYLLWVAQRELPEETVVEERKARKLTSKQVAALEAGELTPDMLPKEVLEELGAEFQSLVPDTTDMETQTQPPPDAVAEKKETE